jgi:YD repeat-containing protein
VVCACSSSPSKPPLDSGIDAAIDAGPVIDPNLPPDPATVAPPLDRGVATSVFAASSFLYTGDHPIQTGVDPATIDGQRVAVLRGRVTGRGGAAVRGGTVTVLGHPEFGQTHTRNDGAYDLVANGGGALVVEVRKDGFLTAQRTIDVPWQDYVLVPAIVMLQPDPAATPIDLTAAGMQVARGSTVTDASGTRRATLLFAPGTQATITDGAATTTLSTLTVHLTEFTNGPTGPAAMPGSLPPTSAYTYAVEITVDEAAGRAVQLNQPAFLYVENFLGFAPGTGIPVGAYDPDRGQWSGLPNGIILKLLGVTSGLADIDSDGDGAADSAATLAALGVSDQERQTLAGLYTAGTALWRSPIPHFSSFDCNRPFRLPGDARRPRLRDPNNPDGDDVDDNCDAGGSIIQCHNQSLGEDVPVSGTPYFLHYQSDRQAGRRADYSVDIALSDNDMPVSATAIAPDGSTTSTAPDGTVVIQKLGPDPRFGMAVPVTASLRVQTPNGLVQTQTTSRTAILSNTDDPASLGTATETFTLNGKSFTRTYDAASKTVTVRTPLGRQAVATLDSKARIVNVTGLSATALEVVYDRFGRPTSIVHGPRVRTLTFGADGRVETSADAVGHAVRYERDAFGRVLRTHQPDGGMAAYTFNANSDLTSVTPSGETSHSFQRDVLGLIQAYFAPDAGPNTQQTSYDYNADHQVTAITAPDGAAIGITYDRAGRPGRVSLAEGTIDATYDVSGRMAGTIRHLGRRRSRADGARRRAS